ncbi:MAG TPA: peptidase M22 [Opitutaceae bacterium]|nr:peptidase M22 [Opitutaceae bacterium]
MPSLRELRSRYAPVLLIDAASATIQSGSLGAEPGHDRWTSADAEAGVGVFAGLNRLGLSPDSFAAFVFCDGPGSILGIRTVAAALRAWLLIRPRPVFRYHSLALVARSLRQPSVQVIADARRGLWHRCTSSGPLERVTAAELGPELVMPAGFRHWAPLPATVAEVSYQLPALLAATEDEDLFTATSEPDAFLHEEPSYATWSPHVHRSP